MTTTAEFKQQRLHVDARFDEVNARFDQVDARFDQIDAQFGDLRQELEHPFQNLEARMIISKAFRPGARIEPIGISVEGDFYPAPNPFPKTVRLFWRLRLPEESKWLSDQSIDH